MQIRRAVEADAGAIAAVHIPSMREAYRTLFPAEALARIDARDRTERWREHLAGGASVTLLAEAGGESIGFADFGRCRDEDISPGTVGEMMAIYVHPAAWGRGVGSALMREALDRLRSDGFADVSLWVIEGNRQGASSSTDDSGFVRDGLASPPRDGRDLHDHHSTPVAVRYNYRLTRRCSGPACRRAAEL